MCECVSVLWWGAWWLVVVAAVVASLPDLLVVFLPVSVDVEKARHDTTN